MSGVLLDTNALAMVLTDDPRLPEEARQRFGEADRADADGFELLPLSPSAALAASLLDWEHRDPFNRMIAVVARQEELLLISADSVFDAIGVERRWG